MSISGRRLISDAFIIFNDDMYSEAFLSLDKIRILDIGCGDGRNLCERLSADKVHTYIGIDILEEDLDLARNRFGNKNFSFIKCNYFEEDFIYCCHLTEFDIINVALPFLGLSTTKINILLETAVTMLREGGYLFITGIDDDIYRKIVPVEYNVATSNYVKRWLRSHKFEEIQEINSGVSKVDVSSEDREAIFCAYFESILQEMKAAGAEYEYSPYHSEYIWCLKNKDRVRESMMDENFRLYLGFTCFRSTKR